MTQPRFKINDEVFSIERGYPVIPNTVGFYKMKIKSWEIKTIETENTKQTNIIYRCEIEDKFRTQFDPYLERNFWGKPKKPYVHIFDINEDSLLTKDEALQAFKNFIGEN